MASDKDQFRSESSKLPRHPRGSGGLFIESQICTSPKPLPSNIDLTGQTAIITGGSAGLGLACAGILLDLGISTLILTVLTEEECEPTIKRLQANHPNAGNADIQTWLLDLASYQSVQDLAARCDAHLSRIDFIILNAGIGSDMFRLNKSTGHEMVMQVNFLSNMLLSVLLLPILKIKDPAGKPGRLSIVNSGTSMHAQFPHLHQEPSILATLDMPENFTTLNQYPLSKFLAHLFVDKLSRYVNPDDVIVNLVDPGLTQGTEINRNVKGGVASCALAILKSIGGRKLVDAATTYVDAVVVKGKETHGSFVMDWKICSYGEAYYAEGREEVQERLWKEVMEEFQFAGVIGIIESMSS